MSLNRRHSNNRAERGFTLAELTIAMAIFSLVMVVMTVTIVNLFHIYQAATGTRNTQQAMRSAIDEISSAGRESAVFESQSATETFAASFPGVQVHQDVLCLYNSVGKTKNATVYFVKPPADAIEGQYALFRTTIEDTGAVSCPTDNTDSRLAGGTQITSSLVSVLNFTVSSEASGKLFGLHIATAGISGITTSDLDFTNPNTPQCTDQTRPQYCTITHIDTSIYPRQKVQSQ